MTCEECIHKSVCYRVGSVPIAYAQKCGDFVSGKALEQEPKWIPVTNRLPEEETDVLICNRNGDIELSRGSYSTEVENDFIWYTSGWRFGKVIAWMPLPEPYKAERSKMDGHTDTSYECAEIVRMAIKEFNQGPKWIPCSDRLPEAEYGESDSVLVCFENTTQDVLYFDGSNWRYPTGEIYISVNHKNGWHNKVVAWMSLPASYDPQERSE